MGLERHDQRFAIQDLLALLFPFTSDHDVPEGPAEAEEAEEAASAPSEAEEAAGPAEAEDAEEEDAAAPGPAGPLL